MNKLFVRNKRTGKVIGPFPSKRKARDARDALNAKGILWVVSQAKWSVNVQRGNYAVSRVYKEQ